MQDNIDDLTHIEIEDDPQEQPAELPTRTQYLEAKKPKKPYKRYNVNGRAKKKENAVKQLAKARVKKQQKKAMEEKRLKALEDGSESENSSDEDAEYVVKKIPKELKPTEQQTAVWDIHGKEINTLKEVVSDLVKYQKTKIKREKKKEKKPKDVAQPQIVVNVPQVGAQNAVKRPPVRALSEVDKQLMQLRDILANK
jgi:hypothetical protein